MVKKPFVAGDEGNSFAMMQIAENFLEILPFRTANLAPNLSRSESPSS